MFCLKRVKIVPPINLRLNEDIVYVSIRNSGM